MGIGIGWDGWFQSIEVYGMKDTGLLMIIGPSLNGKNGKIVGGVRLGTSFVIETEEGEGGTMGFGINGYVGYEFTPNWTFTFDYHYTSTEWGNNDIDIDVSGFGFGVSYNAF